MKGISALEGAKRKGIKAFKDGKKITDCPYADKRCGSHDHIITYSRAFIRAWKKGFEEAEKGMHND